jgi:hypothetical protein
VLELCTQAKTVEFVLEALLLEHLFRFLADPPPKKLTSVVGLASRRGPLAAGHVAAGRGSVLVSAETASGRSYNVLIFLASLWFI